MGHVTEITPLSEMVCHPWASIWYDHLYLPNLKSLFPPTTKIWKATQNIWYGMVWD